MKLVSMKFNAHFVAKENPNEKTKIDYINEKIQFSSVSYLNLNDVINLQKFCVGYSEIIERRWFRDDEYGLPQFFNVIAIKKSNDSWVFLCDSKELFLNIATEFMHAYRLEVTETYILDGSKKNFTHSKWGKKEYNAKCFFNEAVKAYDAKREFLKYLLIAGKDEAHKSIHDQSWLCHNNEELHSYKVAKCVFDMLDDNMKYFVPTIEGCIIFEGVDFNKFYKNLSRLLPENKKVTKEIEQVKIDYGKDFIKKEEVLENYKKSVHIKDFLSQVQKIQAKINNWTVLIENGMIEKSFGEKYIAVLLEKIKILKNLYYNEIYQNLKKDKFNPCSKKECKIQLLEQLRNIQKSDYDIGVNLYEEYCIRESQLEEMIKNLPENVKNLPENVDNLMISQYIEFYRLGKILINNCLNQTNNSFEKERKISQSELDCAMVYFYETDTPQEAYKLQKETEYLDNRKKGIIGEEEVDYALKWLDKSYIVVPKMLSKRHGQQCIELINSNFIDEVQEYDHIVIGKQGVFVIETKNYSGKLIVDTNGNWIRIKRDGTCEGERNPIQQVDRHEKLLKSFLKEDIPVIGLICIANHKAIIEGVDNCSIPLIKSDLLTRFIESYSANNKRLSEDEIKECSLLIEKHRYK